jgi:hypothetical protein
MTMRMDMWVSNRLKKRKRLTRGVYPVLHVLFDVVFQDLPSLSARHSISLKQAVAIVQLDSTYKEILMPSTPFRVFDSTRLF